VCHPETHRIRQKGRVFGEDLGHESSGEKRICSDLSVAQSS
jgi:hypothetical protein